jgi:hypothetical protein
MKAVLRVVACAAAAVLAWLLAFWIAIQIPGTPFQTMFASDLMTRLGDATRGPAAFQEFVALTERMRRIEATVFTTVAALVVVALSRFVFRLRMAEAAAVSFLFAAFVFFFGSGMGWPQTVSIVLFSAVVLLGSRTPLGRTL